MKNKICVYTCITGNYDQLKDPLVVSDGIDYICFTDNQHQFSNAWQIRSVPKDLDGLSNVKRQRIVKICPQRYLSEYDISIWVDGNLRIKGDLNKLIAEYDLDKNPLYTRIHPCRNCIYDEAQACINLNKDTVSNISSQIQQYKSEGYPKHIGMAETCVLLRKHNDLRCKKLCYDWAAELLKYSHRDQLSFNYVCWKNKYIPGYMNKQFNVNNDFFEWRRHG